MPVALQLYTVRHQLAEDFIGTLRRLWEIGYRVVETYPFPPNISVGAAAGILKSLGFEVLSMHTDLPLAARCSTIAEEARQLNCRKVIWHGWPRPAEYDSLDGIKHLATQYNHAHAAARAHGLDLGLHNHWWEFETVAGVYPYTIFGELLAPEIFLEIDTYWVQAAGLNPASTIAELEAQGRRVQFLHLKDGPATQGQPMTALGEGVMDFPGILNGLKRPAQLVVELDECATDVFEALDRSLRYLKSLGAAV